MSCYKTNHWIIRFRTKLGLKFEQMFSGQPCCSRAIVPKPHRQNTRLLSRIFSTHHSFKKAIIRTPLFFYFMPNEAIRRSLCCAHLARIEATLHCCLVAGGAEGLGKLGKSVVSTLLTNSSQFGLLFHKYIYIYIYIYI